MNILTRIHASELAVAASICLININAFGQTQAQAEPAANRIATNLAGITTSMAPPEGFDPLQASDGDLAKYGFPPRPDINADPKAYASWGKAMRASKRRIVPQLAMSDLYHGQKRNGAPITESTGTTLNWSGAVALSGATSYNSSSTFYFVYGEYVVPLAEQAFGACTYSWDYSASWVGIDGEGTQDVLQAGTDSNAACFNYEEASYWAWVEWAPRAETIITNFPVTAGDDMFVEVWHTSPTQGYAYLVNLNTNQWADLGITAPSGTSLTGASAEWVVERPTVGGALSTLTNYIDDVFWYCYAQTENYTPYTPGSPGSLLLTMLDNGGNPISIPTLLGPSAILFQDEGSAKYK